MALVLLLGLAGCDSLEPTTLRLAVNPWPGYGYFAISREQGFLSGPDAPQLEIVETASLSDSIRAFNRGQVDMLGGTLAELAVINFTGKRDARAVLVLDRSVGGDVIVSTKDIASLEHLAGKRLALEPASVNVLVLAAALSGSDLSLGQLDLVPLPQGEMPLAMNERRVDAAISYPPVSLELESLSGVHRLFDTAQTPNAVLDVLIVAEEVIKSYPSALQRIIQAHNEALLWGRENPAEARRLLARHTGLSVEAMAEVAPSIEMLSVEEQETLWQPGGPLERFLQVASQILHQLDAYPNERPAQESTLDRRFISEAGIP